MEQTRVAQPTSWSVVVSDVVAAMDLICPDGSPAFIEPLTTSRAMTLVRTDPRTVQLRARGTLPRYFGTALLNWH